jgi:hypothetical protein
MVLVLGQDRLRYAICHPPAIALRPWPSTAFNPRLSHTCAHLRTQKSRRVQKSTADNDGDVVLQLNRWILRASRLHYTPRPLVIGSIGEAPNFAFTPPYCPPAISCTHRDAYGVSVRIPTGADPASTHLLAGRLNDCILHSTYASALNTADRLVAGHEGRFWSGASVHVDMDTCLLQPFCRLPNIRSLTEKQESCLCNMEAGGAPNQDVLSCIGTDV